MRGLYSFPLDCFSRRAVTGLHRAVSFPFIIIRADMGAWMAIYCCIRDAMYTHTHTFIPTQHGTAHCMH